MFLGKKILVNFVTGICTVITTGALWIINLAEQLFQISISSPRIPEREIFLIFKNCSAKPEEQMS